MVTGHTAPRLRFRRSSLHLAQGFLVEHSSPGPRGPGTQTPRSAERRWPDRQAACGKPAGWHSSKISRDRVPENGRRPMMHRAPVSSPPGSAPDQVADPRGDRPQHRGDVQWSGAVFFAPAPGAAKRRPIALEAETELFRWYEPVLIPGILHTAEYAAAVLTRIISFYEVPDDLEAGVAARMERQQILYRGHHRFHFIVAEQVLPDPCWQHRDDDRSGRSTPHRPVASTDEVPVSSRPEPSTGYPRTSSLFSMTGSCTWRTCRPRWR